jgi:hypothetical protein
MFTRAARSHTIVTRFLFTGLLSVVSLSTLPAPGRDRADDDRWHHEGQGAVFALTNAPSGNAVVAYSRAADGVLTFAGSYATGGNGTGAGLGSQGAVVVSDDLHRRIVAFADRAIGVETVPAVHHEARRLLLASDQPLRMLDALHLALALDAQATAIVTYDPRLRDASLTQGLEVHTPTVRAR